MYPRCLLIRGFTIIYCIAIAQTLCGMSANVCVTASVCVCVKHEFMSSWVCGLMHCSTVGRLFHINYPFSNAGKCSLLSHWSSTIIACYALNKKSNVTTSLFCCIGALRTIRYSLPWSVPVACKMRVVQKRKNSPNSCRRRLNKGGHTSMLRSAEWST